MQISSFKMKLATKVVYLVLLMGFLAIAIIAYAVTEMRRIDTEYQALITTEAKSALSINEAALYLGDVAKSVYALMREGRLDEVRESAKLAGLQAQFSQKIESVRRISPDKSEALDAIDAQAPKLFDAASKVIHALAASDAERALRLVEDELQPEVSRMRFQIGLILAGSNQAFGRAATGLARAANTAIWTTVIAVSLSLALVIFLSTYFVVTRISRPMAGLAGVMERLSRRQYDDTIVGAEGHDELATMARTLQAFKESMQRTDDLARQIADAVQSRRLYAQLEDLASGIPGSVFQFHADSQGNRQYRFLSQKTASLHDLTAQELGSLNVPVRNNLAQPGAEDTDLRGVVAASVRTLAPLDFDMLLARGDQEVWIRTMAAAHRTPDGGALFNGASFDVTRIKQQAQALELAKRTAEITAQEKSEFLAMMSHEIRTPLNAILGMAQLAQKTPLTPAQALRMAQICRSSDHLQRIIDHILNLSKLESGQVVLEVSPFGVAGVMEEVLQMCRLEAGDSRDLRAQSDADVPAVVLGDPFRIRQILVSYVSNAIRFTPSGRIDLTVAAQDMDAQGLVLRFEVLDESDAMDEDALARLFQPFGQPPMAPRHLSDTTSWALGLAISGRLADLMGGSVGARKRQGGGNCFWLTVRVQRVAAGAAASDPGPGPVESRF